MFSYTFYVFISSRNNLKEWTSTPEQDVQYIFTLFIVHLYDACIKDIFLFTVF